MKIKDCLGISNAKLLLGKEDKLLTSFSKDTRTIKHGDTYIGIKGENFDGNCFFEDAFLNGADTCILEHINLTEELKEKYADKNIILVNNSLEFIMAAAKIKRKDIHVPVIAITGSVGKTSTKKIIADMLETKYSVLKTIGNENSQLGMSLRLLNYSNEECIVLEMGMNQALEIHNLTTIAKPDIAIITNIGTSHIGNLGSRENILKAKLEILDGLNGPLIINNDNDLLHKWQMTNHDVEVITLGIKNKSDYQATNISYNKQGSTYELNNEKVFLPVIGDAFIYNSLTAFAVGDLLGVAFENIKEVLSNLKVEPHRMEFINSSEYTIIDDTYNASLDSISSSLDVLSKLKGRKIAVLGDIFELGDYGEEIHRKIGEIVLEKKIDVLITVGDLSKLINEEAENLGFAKEDSFHWKTNKEAIIFLKKFLQAGDIVLIKASHGMNFLEIVEALNE